MSATRAPAVEARQLVKTYPGDVTALDGMDVTVEPGTVFGLLGPNGAGKSTTVKVLTTLARPDSGSATVAGHDVLRHPDRVRRAIGVVAQSSGADPLAGGRENLQLQGRLYGLRGAPLARRVDELLERFGLTDAARRPVKGYSGGMRRRLDVALGLVHRPEVLFLDEPTTGLDPRARNELWDVLETLVDEGATILLTTQYLEEADRLADDIVVVDHGTVIARGDSRSLKRQVGGAQLFATVVDPSRLDDVRVHVGRVAGAEPTIDAESRTVQAPTAEGPRTVSALADALADEGVEVEDLGLRQPTLDDVFLTLTGAAIAAEDEEPVEVTR
jgi:ABC-2 type transport system ATP-binding protein